MFVAATYLINRFPLPFLQFKSPYQLLFNTSSSYSHLKSFGYLCYAATKIPGRDKYQPRSAPCVFIRYPLGKKAYKLYDLQNKIIFTSKDVVFHELCYPFHYIDQPATSPVLVITTDFPTNIYYPMNLPVCHNISH
ncbi:hypothetical protein LIER_23758 [Lithospermum erythrorhizon]|uniref:Retroviral polymerase SH3-like domain-containing protein n=1 Tax=Lithospermum erythrorhizon TaxID=34254 RepID=A0AAV3QYW4_LITER